MTASLLEKGPHDGSELYIYSARDFELMGQSILRQGWRIIAVFEVMVLMVESEFNNGMSTTRNVLRPEARFLCLRGERADLVDDLERQREALTRELNETKKRADALEESTRRLERQLDERAAVVEALRFNLDTAREDRDKAHQHLKDAQARHRTLEAHFGAVRTAIGEITLKKILDAADPKVPTLKEALDPKGPRERG